jgi:hypothetical protein
MSDALEVVPEPGLVGDDKPQTQLEPSALQRRWVLEIERYERKAQQFDKRGKLIIQRFTAEKKDEQAKTTTFNVMWSNIQTLKPSLYSKDPTPEVERRFKDKDPVGLMASEVLERTCTNLLAMQKFGDTTRLAVLDRLLVGRGVMWVRYLPHFRKVPGQDPQSDDAGAQIQTPAQVTRVQAPAGQQTSLTDDAVEDIEEVEWEEVKFDFVPWTDFGHTVARTWEECDGIWRIAYLDRQEVTKRFGAEIASQLSFDQKPDGLDKDADGHDGLSKAKIYEIWDKRTKRVIRLNKAHPTPLEVQDDPLGLDSFWPIPLPLQATISSKSIIPTADYILWQDQAKELDRLSQRIAMLTRALKVVGVYDESVQALGQLLSGGGENQLVPVSAWAAFAEKGGIKGAVELLDVSSVAEILIKLYEARDRVKADIYEISGMSDLLRGASDPEETAAAQKIKASYASVRLKDMQREVQVFARDAIKIAAEIVCSQFALETIQQISGVKLLTLAEKQQLQMQIQQVKQYQQHAQALTQQHQQLIAQQQPQQQPGQPPQPAPQSAPFNPATLLGPPPPAPDPQALKLLQQPSWEDVVGLLRDRPLRNFRIDIETDSTIAQDERAEQESRLGFAKVVGELLTAAEQAMQSVPEMAPAIAETFMFVLRSYKVGRPTESAFQEAMDKLVAKAEQPQQPKPDPEQVKAQAAIQQVQAKAQADSQVNQQRVQADIALDNQKLQNSKELEQFKAEQAMRVEQFKQNAQAHQNTQQNQIEAQRADMDARNDERMEQMRMAFDAHAKSVDQQIAVLIAHLNNMAKIEVAEIAAKTTLDAAQISAAKAAEGGSDATV